MATKSISQLIIERLSEITAITDSAVAIANAIGIAKSRFQLWHTINRVAIHIKKENPLQITVIIFVSFILCIVLFISLSKIVHL